VPFCVFTVILFDFARASSTSDFAIFLLLVSTLISSGPSLLRLPLIFAVNSFYIFADRVGFGPHSGLLSSKRGFKAFGPAFQAIVSGGS